MFTYQLVAKEIDEIFSLVTMARTTAYEAMTHSNGANDHMCETKLQDLKARSKELQKLLSTLDTKIEYIKNQS